MEIDISDSDNVALVDIVHSDFVNIPRNECVLWVFVLIHFTQLIKVTIKNTTLIVCLQTQQ